MFNNFFTEGKSELLMDVLHLLLIQAEPLWERRSENLAHYDSLLPDSVFYSFSEGPRLILLPEMFATAFSLNVASCAEPQEGKTLAWMRSTALRLRTAVYGSVLIEENKQYYNRGFFVFPDGSYKTYDKRHLFRMSEEGQLLTAGNKNVTVDYASWKIRLSICYDLRFPLWLRNRYHEGQYAYDLLLNVASWPSDRAHVWRTLLHARAIENQAYVAGVNRVGIDGKGVSHRGDSLLIDARGIGLAVSNPEREEIIKITISKQSLCDFRRKFSVGEDWDNYEITN